MKFASCCSLAALILAANAASLSAGAETPIELPPIDAADPDEDRDGTMADAAPGRTVTSRANLRSRSVSTPDPLALMSRDPALSVQSNGGIASLPVLRGLSDDRVGVLIDGQAATNYCPNHMNPVSSYIDASRVERIIVTPTLSPVSLGGDNIAGIISIETRAPDFSDGGVEVFGKAGVRYQSVSNGVGGSLEANTAGEKLSARYEASWNRADNYKAGDGREVRSTLYENYDQSLLLAAAPADDVLVWVRLGQQGVPYEGFANQRMDLVDNKSNSIQLHAEGPVGPGLLSADVSWREVDHEMNFLADKGGAANGGMPMITEGEDVSAKLKYELGVSGFGDLGFGAEIFQSSMDDYWPAVPGSMMMSPLDYININDGKRDRTGIWAEWQARPSEKWSTLLGVRYERVEMDAGDVQPYSWTGMMNMADAMAAMAFNASDRAREDDNLDVTAKAVWQASRDLTVEFGAAQKSRSPNLYERYAWGRGSMAASMTNMTGDGAGYVGDISLEPEVARSVAATLVWTSQREDGPNLRASAWASQVSDYIDANRIGTLSDGLPILQFANHDAELYGLEVSGDMPLAVSDLGETRLSGSVSWARGTNEDTGDNLYNIAPLKGFVTLENRKGRWTQALEVELVNRKDRVNALRLERETDAYALLHLRAGADLGRYNLTVSVENILDTDYDLPLGGIAFGDFRYGGRIGPYRQVSGPGRSINAGVSVAF